MAKRIRKHAGFSLDPETIAAIKLKAIEEENDSRALDLIVAEWLEEVKFEPLNVQTYYL